MYSLVNVAVLCRDLARHPYGRVVVDDLLRAFTLDDAGLASLDAGDVVPAAERLRRGALDSARGHPQALQVLAAARAASADLGVSAWTGALGLLDTAPLGDIDALLRFTADDVLAAHTQVGDLAVTRHARAVAVVTDGVLASWVGPGADEVGAPWRSWSSSHDVHPARVDDAGLRSVLRTVATAGPARLDAAAHQLREARARGWSWPAAMHDACWAVRLTGRGRTAAIAQLQALASVLATTAPAAPRPDVVAAVVAAVHATAVDDLLDSATVRAMTQPLLRSLA